MTTRMWIAAGTLALGLAVRQPPRHKCSSPHGGGMQPVCRMARCRAVCPAAWAGRHAGPAPDALEEDDEALVQEENDDEAPSALHVIQLEDRVRPDVDAVSSDKSLGRVVPVTN